MLRAISSLEMFTLIARNVCTRMVEEGAIAVIFHLFATCNRSTPHQRIVGHGLRTLTNLCKLAGLRAPLCEQQGALAALVDLAQGYRDKKEHKLLWDVLQLLCELVLRGPAEWREKIAGSSKSQDCVKRLDSLHGLLERASVKENGPANAKGKAAPPPKSKAAPGAKPVNPKGNAAKKEIDLSAKCVGALKAILNMLSAK